MIECQELWWQGYTKPEYKEWVEGGRYEATRGMEIHLTGSGWLQCCNPLYLNFQLPREFRAKFQGVRDRDRVRAC